jgi:hypothetical protein
MPSRRSQTVKAKAYEQHKENARKRQESISRSARDIADKGWVHKPVKPARKRRAAKDFRYFCETYFPETFTLAWSQDHLRVIAKIEKAVLQGGQFAMAMPRGSGKTSLCEAACLWATLCGHRQFVVIISAEQSLAEASLDSIKSEIENNDTLEEDFSEVCGPVRALEGIHQRAAGQIYNGKQTYIGWTADELVFPVLPKLTFATPGCGNVIRGAGLTGSIRGMKFKRADGANVRPDLVIVDDPQTDESARSPSQCATRERILNGAVLGLAGPTRKIAALMPATVIAADDMADRMLDPKRHPVWQGERTRMVCSFPTNQKLWDEYAELRRAAQADRAAGLSGPAEVARRCNEFYRRHRAEMDAGAEVAWPERRFADEVSAIQHAMNLRIDRGDVAFFAEYQNEPIREDRAQRDLLKAEQIAAKVNGLERGIVSLRATHLTAMIDVHDNILFWVVAAWEPDFTGYVVDYGTEPDQGLSYFTQSAARQTLQMAAPKAGQEGWIYAGLERLTTRLMNRAWQREDGEGVQIERLMIDARWGVSTELVKRFCRQSVHRGVLLPSFGQGIKASQKPMSEWQRRPGERVGLNWRLGPGTDRQRRVIYDTNFWKTYTFARLAVAIGDPGCLSLFGSKPEQHRLFAEHLTAEYPDQRTSSLTGRTIAEWELRANRDNHWFDCLVGCAVGASIAGATIAGGVTQAPQARPRVRRKWSDVQREKLAQRGL